MIELTDCMINPKTDKLELLFWVPELAIITTFPIDRHEDITKILPQLKQDILSGKLP